MVGVATLVVTVEDIPFELGERFVGGFKLAFGHVDRATKVAYIFIIVDAMTQAHEQDFAFPVAQKSCVVYHKIGGDADIMAVVFVDERDVDITASFIILHRTAESEDFAIFGDQNMRNRVERVVVLPFDVHLLVQEELPCIEFVTFAVGGDEDETCDGFVFRLCHPMVSIVLTLSGIGEKLDSFAFDRHAFEVDNPSVERFFLAIFAIGEQIEFSVVDRGSKDLVVFAFFNQKVFGNFLIIVQSEHHAFFFYIITDEGGIAMRCRDGIVVVCTNEIHVVNLADIRFFPFVAVFNR